MRQLEAKLADAKAATLALEESVMKEREVNRAAQMQAHEAAKQAARDTEDKLAAQRDKLVRATLLRGRRWVQQLTSIAAACQVRDQGAASARGS